MNKIILFIIILAIGILNLLKINSKSKDVDIETQLTTFKSLGFHINEGVDIHEMINNWGIESEFEKPPYVTLYIMLGASIEKEPWTPVTDQVWLFDTEAIEGKGSYIEIMENIRRISSGELKFENIEDNVDIAEAKASVSFDLNGKHYVWDLKVQDDWVDEGLFLKIVELTNEHKTKGKLTYFDEGGQNMVLGWATPEQLEKIKDKTGLNIIWLE